MRTFLTSLALLGATAAYACDQCASYNDQDDFKIVSAQGQYSADWDTIALEIQVAGEAGRTLPTPKGQLDGAPVLSYVFPTNLQSTDVGFSSVEGIVALALTSHPDFDDTPLWDENRDSRYDNDGIVWHPHWVVLVKDERVPGGLSVRQFEKGDPSVVLPPTNPGMPMFMDSPGFPVLQRGNTIRAVLPASRLNGRTDFKFDGVTCYLQVNTSDPARPMLGVMRVYGVASGDLSLPYALEPTVR